MKKLFFLILPFALAGCGGGSGGPGGPDGPTFTSFAEMKAGETTTIKGKGREATATGEDDSDFALTSFSSAKVSTEVTTNSDGDITSIALTTPTSKKVLNEENISEYSSISDDGKFLSLESKDDKIDIAFAEPGADGFEYQTYGTWFERDFVVSEANIGAASIGSDTPVANIPSSGKATFKGTAGGEYIDYDESNIPEWHYMTSEATLNADFARRSVDFKTDDTKSLGGVAKDHLDLTGTMTYSAGSNEMSGNVRTANGMTGKIDGRFYGPGAQEVGGTFAVKGDGIERYYGGYGAKKQ
ncbi:transferrin-binding protein-like solute binding protein [Chelativorans alearense]|uniref:transferrin-binding protein-like solute binding protein n=1 Tax=Chelativorans alearense TaxID=2681495 RepID=UPI0013D8A84A|nr:transferrin-binding protein-like solute binding protein [Chelativorans alearense]